MERVGELGRMVIKGRLLLGDGTPAAGYRLWANEEQVWRVTFDQVETGGDGQFALPSRLAGTAPAEGETVVITFYVTRGYTWSEIFEAEVTWSASGELSLDLQLHAPTDGPYFHVFSHVTDGTVGVHGVLVHAVDTAGGRPEQKAVSGPRGWCNLWFPFGDGSPPQLELSVAGDEGVLPTFPVSVYFDADRNAWAWLTLAYEVSGTVVDRGTGKGVEQLRVELWDASGTSMLGSGVTDATGAFAISMPRSSGPPIETPVLRVYWLSQLLETATPKLSWNPLGRAEGVALEIGREAEPLPIYTVRGTAIDRATRRGAPGLRAEAWAPDGSYMLAVADTDDAGRFTVTLSPGADGVAPQARFRLYRDGQVVAQPDLPLVWAGNAADVFIEADLPAAASRTARITGRLIEETTHDALGGLRVEAWDTSLRDGGMLGVSAVTASDGSFELAFPLVDAPAPVPPPRSGIPGQTPPIYVPPPALERAFAASSFLAAAPAPPPVVDVPRPTRPKLVFRIYDGDRLATVVVPQISWAAEGVATTIVEIAAPTAPGSSLEVGLHEIGESVASTVDRVQTELARYPNAMGAYLLDEIDLRVPVEMRVDDLGQVRTKVVDAANATGPQVGQLHLRIRPVLGAAQRAADVPDQPLSVLEELTPHAIAKLEGQRIYSVENLVRVAASGAGRAALGELELGVDLTAPLAKAALLAFPDLPRAVREACVQLGIASLQAFARYLPRAELANELEIALGQELSEDDVAAWQAAVERAISVPRPSAALAPTTA